MKPTEALDLLDKLVASTSLSRIDHVRMQQAVTVLAEAIKPKVGKAKGTKKAPSSK